MKNISVEQLSNTIGGRNPNWGDFFSGVCISVGLGTAILGTFSGNKFLSIGGNAMSVACGAKDILEAVK